MDDRYSVASPSTTSGVVPGDTRFVEHDIDGITFRFTRRLGSDFVGVLRLGLQPTPEIYGYAANLDTNTPAYSRFHRWHSTQDALNQLWTYAVTLHQIVRERDEQPAVAGNAGA